MNLFSMFMNFLSNMILVAMFFVIAYMLYFDLWTAKQFIAFTFFCVGVQYFIGLFTPVETETE